MASPASEDRWIALGPGCAKLPERLLLAHARGKVLFISGAGISLSAGLPDFRGLVLEVYRQVDPPVHLVMQGHVESAVEASVYALTSVGSLPDAESLSPPQQAEVRRFLAGDYDVVLGMLERRMDGRTLDNSRVRQTVAAILGGQGRRPAPMHKALMKLADRGAATTTITTNFDLLLEKARVSGRPPLKSFALGGIPRPGNSSSFEGVLHIHGALSNSRSTSSDLVLTDHDFGEYYLRRRVVPDFIYDAARLFHLVLVGYSANDAPMRYLLNAVAADGFRFDDLKERFAFVGQRSVHDNTLMEDWKGRGITPIPYDTANGHAEVSDTLVQWANIGPRSARQATIDRTIRRLVATTRAAAAEADRDLFDHLVRRGSNQERNHISATATEAGADPTWLDAIVSVGREPSGEATR